MAEVNDECCKKPQETDLYIRLMDSMSFRNIHSLVSNLESEWMCDSEKIEYV